MAVGAYLGAVAVLLVVLLAIADGSLFPRLGRALEDEVGKELQKAPGVFAVVSGVSFAHRDVDHVLLARAGCFAVEVKATFRRRQRLDQFPELPANLAQARDGARQIELLLGSRGVSLQLTPVLILTGSGAPDMTSPEWHDDVLVVSLRNGHAWRSHLAGLDSTLDEATAKTAASELLAYRRQRTDYELTQS